MGANSALIFGIIINVAILLVFFRFLMQLAAVNFYNPVVMSTVKATKIVDMFGRIFPNVAKGRVNLAALVLLVLLYLLKIFGVMYLSGAMPNSPVHLVILTFVTMIQDDSFLSLPDFCNDYFKLGGDVYAVTFALYRSDSRTCRAIIGTVSPFIAQYGDD